MRDLCESAQVFNNENIVKPISFGDFTDKFHAANSPYPMPLEDPVVVYDTHYDVDHKEVRKLSKDKSIRKVVYGTNTDSGLQDKTILVIQFGETEDMAPRNESLMFRSEQDASAAKGIFCNAIQRRRHQSSQKIIDGFQPTNG